MNKAEEKRNCYNCKFRGSVPGSAHISCKFDWVNHPTLMPKGDEHGKRNGWWIFPYNYDPVWMIGECSKHKL